MRAVSGLRGGGLGHLAWQAVPVSWGLIAHAHLTGSSVQQPGGIECDFGRTHIERIVCPGPVPTLLDQHSFGESVDDDLWPFGSMIQ